MRLYNSLIISIITYSSASWTLTKVQKKRLDAFNTKALRRIVGVRWHDYVTNASILIRTGQPPLTTTIRKLRLMELFMIRRYLESWKAGCTKQLSDLRWYMGVSVGHCASKKNSVYIPPKWKCSGGVSVYSRIWKLPVIFFLQLPMYVRCAAMRGAPQCAAHRNARRTAMRGAQQFDWHNTCQTLKTAAEHHIQTTV